MFTVFHFLELSATMFGVVGGAMLGHRWLGWVGAVVGAVAGLLAGWVLAQAPYLLGVELLKRNLKRCDVATLRSRLDQEYYISQFIITQLVVRGEPIESFRDYVAALRRSDCPDRRRFGEELLRLWPETAEPSTPTAPEG